jgi:hypothetical protein
MEEQGENKSTSESPSQLRPIFTNINETIQQLAAIVLGAGTILSLGGYIIVQSYLKTWTDIQPYNVVPIQYLAAGAGFLFFTAVTVALIWLSFNLAKGRNLLLFIMIVVGISLLATNLSFGTSADFWLSLVFPLAIIFMAAGLIFIVQILWKFIYWISPKKLKDFFTRSVKPASQKNFELLSMRSFSIFVLGLIYTILGALSYNELIYSRLPRYFGGGAFSDISIILKDPDEWYELTRAIYQTDENVNYMYGLCLLAELDDAYLVIIPIVEGLDGQYYTITVPRASVLSIIDSDYGKTCSVNPATATPPPTTTEAP